MKDFLHSKYDARLSWALKNELFRNYIKPLFTRIITNIEINEGLNSSLEEMAKSGEVDDEVLTKEILEQKKKKKRST